MKAGRFTTQTARTASRLALALAALLFLAPLAIGQALGSDCGSSYRMSHGDSDCMHAWWDNSPSLNCWGTKGGAQSFCSDYGTVVVKVDLVSHGDLTVHRNNSEKWRYSNCFTDTNAVSCCIDKSDLCVKNQVEADANDKINRRFDGINQRLDDFNDRVNQRFDDFNGRFDGVNQRFDDANDRVNQRFDDFNDRVNQRFDDFNGRFDGVNQRFDGVNQRFDQMGREFAALRERIARLDRALEAFVGGRGDAGAA